MTTVGDYLATRLAQIGLKHHFVVPGDYNLVLLDRLLLNKQMQQVNCANELNCAFAAEGAHVWIADRDQAETQKNHLTIQLGKAENVTDEEKEPV